MLWLILHSHFPTEQHKDNPPQGSTKYHIITGSITSDSNDLEPHWIIPLWETSPHVPKKTRISLKKNLLGPTKMQLFAPPPADAQRAVLMKLLLSRYTQHVPALSPHPSFSQRATSSLMLLFPQLVKPQQLQRCQTAGDCDIISQCLTPIRPSQLCTMVQSVGKQWIFCLFRWHSTVQRPKNRCVLRALSSPVSYRIKHVVHLVNYDPLLESQSGIKQGVFWGKPTWLSKNHSTISMCSVHCSDSLFVCNFRLAAQ